MAKAKRPSSAASTDAGRVQLLIDSVVDYAIYMLDLKGRVESWNLGAVRLKGYSVDEILGQHFGRESRRDGRCYHLARSFSIGLCDL